MPPQSSLLDGHVPGKWWKICLPDSAYTTKVCIPLFLTTRPLSAKYQVNSLPSFIWSSLEYMTLDIQKKRCASPCIASYTFQLPSICLLRTALKKFCSNNGGLLAGICHLFEQNFLAMSSVLLCFFEVSWVPMSLIGTIHCKNAC